MKAFLRIYKNVRPVHWYKYMLNLNNKTIMTNSKEEIKMLLDLNGKKMYRFCGLGENSDHTNLYYTCYYN